MWISSGKHNKGFATSSDLQKEMFFKQNITKQYLVKESGFVLFTKTSES